MSRAPLHRRLARAALTLALVVATPGIASANGSLVDGYVGLGARMGDRPPLPEVMPGPIAFPARGPAAHYPLRGPTEVRIASGGALIVAEAMTGRVLRVGRDGRVSVIPGRTADDLALCGGPRADGVVASRIENRLFRGPAPSAAIAGTGRTGFAGDGGPATSARLNGPTCAAPAADGGILVADQGNNRVRRIAPDGTISTIAGNGAPVFSVEGGPAIATGMVPHAIVALPDGGALVTDPRNARVLRIHPDGSLFNLRGHRDPRVRRRRRARTPGAPHRALGDRARRRRQRGGGRLRQPDRPADLAAGRDHHGPRRAAAAGRLTVARHEGVGPGAAPGVPLGRAAARPDELGRARHVRRVGERPSRRDPHRGIRGRLGRDHRRPRALHVGFRG